jgi:hypothetical protein
MRSPLFALATGAVLALSVSGCADDGSSATGSSAGSTGSTESTGSTASTGSTGSTGSTASSGSTAGTASAVPEGVAAQYATLEEEIAEAGGATVDGPWRIGYIVEAAEPWYENHHGHESWRPPQPGETNHIEIIPMERSTGRIVPDTPITLTVLDSNGTVVEEKALNFYYSDFFHYANNFELPKSGDYTLRAKIEPPTFNRHGEQSEAAPLAQGATVTFGDVHIDTTE